MSKIIFQYVMQVCDTASYQGQKRFCGDNRTLLSKKSIKSFYDALITVANHNKDTEHNLKLILDKVSNELKTWIESHILTRTNINIEIENLTETGIRKSIEHCYKLLAYSQCDFVYQLQDDYIFRPNVIVDMASLWFEIYHDTHTECIITPYNDPYPLAILYKNKIVPRAIFRGITGYYFQIYELSCSFFTSKNQFNKHWDLYNKFFDLIDNRTDDRLESASINQILVQRGVLGIAPITSLALHLQSETEKDPYIDWETWWNSIDVT